MQYLIIDEIRKENEYCLFNVADAAGAADDQHIFDLNVRLQYSDDATVLLQALQVRPLLLFVTPCS